MPSKVVAFIPNLLTLCNLCAGTIAIILMDIFWSPILIIVAAIFDVFDGAAARALGVTSEIGKELDSMCDMVSFGLAPALIYVLLVPNESIYLLLAPLALVSASAWRLAKFNTLPSYPYFIGLATPAAALCIVGLSLGVYWGSNFTLRFIENPIIYLVFALFLSWAMIRGRHMVSFKGWNNKTDRIWLLIIAAAFLILLILDYRICIFGGFLAYIILNEVKYWLGRNAITTN